MILQLVWRAGAGGALRENLGVWRGEEHRVRLCRCPDDRIGEFDPMAATKTDGALRNRFVDGDNIKAVQKMARRGFEIAIGSNHYLHPGDDADRLLGVALKFGVRLGNSIEVVDQDVGVEQRLNLSLSSF